MMAKLVVYNSVSLDGFFTDAKGDMSWAHKRDPEWQVFIAENAAGGGRLLFGRVTYDLMASFWPTPLAAQTNPVMAERMNGLPKFVASRTLETAAWSNTTLLKGELTAQVRQLKQQPGSNIVIMGSGSIVAQLADAGLVDEYQIVLNPLVLGHGRTLFEGVKNKLALKLAKSRTFGNGNVVMFYEPAA
jgi:dihydrofolate reductase